MWNFIKEWRYGILTLLLISGVIALICFDRAKLNREVYRDLDCVVVKVGQENTRTRDKFHTPTETNLLLLRSLKDSTMFMEYRVNDQKFYNTRVGDTLHWDIVAWNRFFYITR